jgi:hypothetical protein
MYLTRTYFRLCDICHYFNVDERPICPLYFCVKNTGLKSQQVANINWFPEVHMINFQEERPNATKNIAS